MDITDLILELEAVPDAGAGGEAPPADAGSEGGGAAGAAPDAGAAAGGETTPVEPAVPAATPAIDWDSPEVADRIAHVVEQREQAAAQAAADEQARVEAQTEWSDVEEGLSLLGIDPSRFKEYLGVQNAPLAQVAEQVQAAEAVKWVDGQLAELGKTHPDLLGPGIESLAEFKTDDGAAMFDPADVSLANRNAVLFAASALEQAARSSGQQIDHGAALSEGAKQVAQRDDLVGKIAVERYKRDLSGSGNAPADISGGGAGVSRLTGLEGGDELAVARRINAEAAR